MCKFLNYKALFFYSQLCKQVEKELITRLVETLIVGSHLHSNKLHKIYLPVKIKKILILG